MINQHIYLLKEEKGLLKCMLFYGITEESTYCSSPCLTLAADDETDECGMHPGVGIAAALALNQGAANANSAACYL